MTFVAPFFAAPFFAGAFFTGAFFAGAFLCNAIPHLASGLRGEAFPTPFVRLSRPRSDVSSPLLNALWGAFNLAVGIALYRSTDVMLGANVATLVMSAGALLLGIYLSRHFEKVRNARNI